MQSIPQSLEKTKKKKTVAIINNSFTNPEIWKVNNYLVSYKRVSFHTASPVLLHVCIFVVSRTIKHYRRTRKKFQIEYYKKNTDFFYVIQTKFYFIAEE